MKSRKQIEDAIERVQDGSDEEGRDFSFHRDQEVEAMVLDALRWVIGWGGRFGEEIARYETNRKS